MARVNFVIAGACGLLLAAGGMSPAQAWGGPWGGGDSVWDSDTYASFHAGLHCPRRARVCVNGPLNSGNLQNSQNVYMRGNNNDSGSPTNINGNTNSHDETHGVESRTRNHLQNVGRHHRQGL
ncbi:MULTISPECIES: hypothetical protein [Streptomyces]|uniref:hypothetical protein n=1 Tax=Streptomyces TaxID=1883 RepID=UPI0020209F1B|nr:hypothetical protein [Streptomyces sp. MCA2]MCL7490189.1 hypothetical protein [Streptomyces sp. MCA2]